MRWTWSALIAVGIAVVAVVAVYVDERPGPSQVARVTPTPAPTLSYSVQRVFPHDPEAFTQGLDFVGDRFYESTGIEGRSTLRRVRLSSGKVLEMRRLGESHFGEGITIRKGRVFWLTWKSQKAFLFRESDLRRVGRFVYDGEGWGLTHNGSELIMSNGSSELTFRDPQTFEVLRTVPVTDAGQPVADLNELEWVNGSVYANVWLTDDIVIVDPITGFVTARINIKELHDRESAERQVAETNGIAYKPEQDRLFVTGKFWSHVYEVRVGA